MGNPADSVEFLCGNCRAVCPVETKFMPAVSRTCAATIHKGHSLQLSLSKWNSLILCQECKGWNWNTDDERITSFSFPCPICGSATEFKSLGRKFVLGGEFLKPVVIGDLRLAGKSLTLKCGHPIYLPTLSKGHQLGVAVAAPTPASVQPAEESKAASQPPTTGTNPTAIPLTKKSDTQKISTP
jgi:hypothetical protein